MKTIELLSNGQKEQLKEIILAFWDRKIDGVNIKIESKNDEYDGLELCSNWLVQLISEMLEKSEDKIKE